MKNIEYELIFILLLASRAIHAQSLPATLENYFNEIRTGNYAPLPESIFTSPENGAQLLTELQPYTTDTMTVVRSRAYYLVRRIGEQSTAVGIRQTAIDHLVHAVADMDSGISGQAGAALTAFLKADFTTEHKQQLTARIRQGVPHLDRVIRLAGYLEIEDARPVLETLLSGSTPNTVKWAARIALARMGNQNTIDYIMEKLRNAPVNDNLVYSIIPDLVYTRQPAIFQYLSGIIMSDAPDCTSADPDSAQKILCGYRVLEYIARAIEGFPVPVDKYGEAIINDYEQTLLIVRNWLNTTDYEIRTDNF